MNRTQPIPTLDEVQRIVNIQDPNIRNLQITQCYSELSNVLTWRTGLAANWCTFATWASKQAGQTIRKEDLRRLLESRLRSSQSTLQAAASVAATANPTGSEELTISEELALSDSHFTTAIDRASDAVSRGNKKVFEEIGYEFARFYDTCLPDQTPDMTKIAQFCEQLRPGDPPDGQDYLRQAFNHYYQVLFEQDTKTRAELMFMANIKIGLHEQIRLQPEIAESLDAGLINYLQFTRSLFSRIFPFSGWFKLAHLYARRILRRPTKLDMAIQSLLTMLRSQLRQTITEMMMTISLPSGVRLSLHKDLEVDYPDSLKQIMNPELSLLLDKYDPSPGSTVNSGAIDWADLYDRLHFIIDMFRCYQENQDLFMSPFTTDQVKALKNGKLPAGRL